MALPAAADIEAFEVRVSEVSRLVDGLRSGALSADYVAAQEARCKKLSLAGAISSCQYLIALCNFTQHQLGTQKEPQEQLLRARLHCEAVLLLNHFAGCVTKLDGHQKAGPADMQASLKCCSQACTGGSVYTGCKGRDHMLSTA